MDTLDPSVMQSSLVILPQHMEDFRAKCQTHNVEIGREAPFMHWVSVWLKGYATDMVKLDEACPYMYEDVNVSEKNALH